MLRILLTTFLFYTVSGRQGFGPTDQEWGYSNVRTGSYIFWWLHYTTADVSNPTERPLIIWLQGGPGASSTGYGNFAELGPLDLELKPRNTTWVQWANVLFVDNPVGSGFSYIDESGSYAENNTQIAKDFLVFLKDFYKKLPQFDGVPLYIFCESYGGKMTPDIAAFIYRAQQNGEINTNLRGIGLGDGWVSSIEIVEAYADYCLNLGLIDDDGYNAIQGIAEQVKPALDNGEFVKAFNLWGDVTAEIEEKTYNVDFYNVLLRQAASTKKMGLYRSNLGDALDDIMNGQVAAALNLTSKWQDVNYSVYNALLYDFMKPVTSVVEDLLDNSNVFVAVYNGQLDLIINTPGTANWINRLNFEGKSSWDQSKRIPFNINGYMEGYVRKNDKFAFYWVNNAGHMVPSDNPSAMEYILKDVTNNFKV
ncbi:retinoid-inducible serine carboxypeptidase-like [Diorhabda sublineata]|uniref:retinoid-inducible serine carboxypeptidase-like n=1 Tax=Diorhabda sublineata TaxID=1163346 RepID=UPI0024E04678|nr:retinoid-inducible serine carboxypeptidase-like [Diorhabda sublineata]